MEAWTFTTITRGSLERPDLDAVLVFADNRTSVRLGLQVLARGLPVMIEKPIAADLRAARRSLPSRWQLDCR